MQLKENDRVRTLVEKEGHPVGTIGVLVSVYADGKAGEVEVWDQTGYPIDVVTYELSELSIVPLDK